MIDSETGIISRPKSWPITLKKRPTEKELTIKNILTGLAIAIICLAGCDSKNPRDGFRQISSSGPGPAALLSDEIAIGAEGGKIMAALADSDVKLAFTHMEKIFPLPAEDFAKLKEDTTKMLESAQPRFGKPLGYEPVSLDKKSDSVLVGTYILKMENIALRWRFVFYKPKDKWIINSMRWDDKLGDD